MTSINFRSIGVSGLGIIKPTQVGQKQQITNLSQSSSAAISKAQTDQAVFSSASQDLAGISNVLEFAQNNLTKISQITEKLIDLSARAAKADATDSQRSKLQVEFNKVGNEFKQLVDSAQSQGNIDHLSERDLKSVFQSIGLDEQSSSQVAGIFNRFITPTDDANLASANYDGTPQRIVNARQPVTPESTNYDITKITNNTEGDTITGYVSAENNIYASANTEGGLNPSGILQPFISTDDGNLSTVSTLSSPQFTGPATLVNVLESTGESLITSSQDLTGENAMGINQLFLISADGSSIRQLTLFSADYNITAADYEQTSGTLLIVADTLDNGDNADGGQEVFLASNLGIEDPIDESAFTQTTDLANSTTISGLELNQSNTKYYAYKLSTDRGPTIKETISGIEDTTFANHHVEINHFGFIGDNNLALIDTNNAVYVSSQGSVEQQTLAYNVSAAHFSENGGITYASDGIGIFRIEDPTIDSPENLINYFALGASDTVTNLSYSNTGAQIKIGLVGTLTSRSANSEFYVLKPYAVDTNALASDPNPTGSALDGVITDRANALKNLADLKAVNKEIKSNIKELEKARKFVDQNKKLSEASAAANATIVAQPQDYESASEISKALKQKIRDNVSNQAVLAQTKNLDSIRAAKLLED